jgi:hypothetical protein
MLGGFVGALLFGETERYFDNWYNNSGYFGIVTLDQVFGTSKGVVVIVIVLVALLAFWGAEHLERIFGKRDLAKEPKSRLTGALVMATLAFAVLFIGNPSFEEKYNKLTFTRTETIPQLNADPITVTTIYTADEMLENRLVFTSPAEAFKTKYDQSVKPVFFDVRKESDFNLYHIEDAVNVPFSRVNEVIPVLLTEPPANIVYILMSNDEEMAVDAWKVLVTSGVPNVYILEGGVNNWIAFFGNEDMAIIPNPAAGNDQLGYIFPSALGDRYESCSPSPIEYEELEFEAKIQLQLKRDKSGGGCG